MRHIAKIRMIAVVAVLVVGGSAAFAQSADEVYEPGRNGISSPVPIKMVKAQHPKAAREAGIEGVVRLRVVVRADGTVYVVAVDQSVDKEHGVDDAAIAAAKQWIFKPARKIKTDEPVAVRATIELAFTLK